MKRVILAILLCGVLLSSCEPALNIDSDTNEESFEETSYFSKLENVAQETYRHNGILYKIQEDGEIIVGYGRDDEKRLEPKWSDEPWHKDELAVNASEKASDIWYELTEKYGTVELVHKDGEWYYFTLLLVGGGSMEYYGDSNSCRLIKINQAGDYWEYGDFRGAHIQECNNRFYYVEMKSFNNSATATGKLCSMNLDGSDPTVLENEIQGRFYIHEQRAYYWLYSDKTAYRIDISGANREKLNDNMIPYMETPWGDMDINFYDSQIINWHWREPYSSAIMDLDGENIVLFPDELKSISNFNVINWDEFFVFLRTDSGDIWMITCRGKTSKR